MTIEEIADKAQAAYARFYGDDGRVAVDVVDGRWTEDVVAGLCLLLGHQLHDVVQPDLFGGHMYPELVGPICEALLAEALSL